MIFGKKKRNLFYLANSFSVKFGGRTKATFFRAEMLEDFADNHFIMTFNYRLHYGEIIDEIKTSRHISPKITFLNVFEYYAGEDLYSKEENLPKKLVQKNPEYDYEYIEEKNAYKVFDGGIQISYIQLNSDNTVDYMDSFDERKRRIRREQFDRYGRLRKEMFYDMNKKKAIRSNFLTKAGRVFLTIDYDSSTGEAIKCYVFDQNQNIKHLFSSENELREFWLFQLHKQYNNALFFCEDRDLDFLLSKNRFTKEIRSVAVVHSSHLRKPYKFGSPVNEYNGRLLGRIPEHTAVVVLTKEQKRHIFNQFGMYENLYQIPHPAPETAATGRKDKDRDKIVVVARFVKLKRIEDILKAFQIAVRSIPQAKLELWGTGEEKQEYQKFIDEENLGDSIKIKGYTTAPDEVFSSAGISVITSKYEGFGMTILESMINETPVISYDFNYGPKELIDDGKNGFLVEDGNVEMLAEKMIYLLEHREVLDSFAAEAKNKAKDFNVTAIRQMWIDMIQEIEKESKNRKAIISKKVLFAKVDEAQTSFSQENGKTKIDLHLNILVSNEDTSLNYYVYLKNIYGLDRMENRYARAEQIHSGNGMETLTASFEFDSAILDDLEGKPLELTLGITDGKEFSFVDIHQDSPLH